MKITIVYIIITSIIILAAGCTAPYSIQTLERNSGSRGFAPYFGSFDKVWNERTIPLPSAESQGTGMMLPFTGGSNPDEAFAFPLAIRATYMDSTLLDAGFIEFSRLTRMTKDEQSVYMERYKKAHIANDTLFIWTEIQTTSTEEFLNLRRWTIFLENDEGKQFEPTRMVEHPLERTNRTFFPPGERNRRGSPVAPNVRSINTIKKNVELYFPIHRFDDSLFTPHASYLKFVILDTEHPLVRAEAAWALTVLNH